MNKNRETKKEVIEIVLLLLQTIIAVLNIIILLMNK